jgi:hypothetical protein
MQPPAPYSNTDTVEIESINTLNVLLDPSRVKADLRQRDKFPNSDGYLELVDEQGRPCGKVEVQIKRIASTGLSSSCPGGLVGYATVTTLPVIFVGVDPINARAYWTHVHPLMPEFKAGQKSFTIHFAEALDYIDRTPECPCYHRWLELARDYQTRVRVPTANAIPKPTMACLSADHVEALQRFIDVVNQLIDHDFSIVKALLFPGIWKFGVGCRLVGHDLVLYQLLRAPKGRLTPLVIELPETVKPLELGKNVESAVTLPRDDFFSDPERHARKFVFTRLRQLVSAKALPVNTAALAADVVFGFIHRYHRWLEINPHRDEYFIGELREAFGPRLSKNAGAVARRLPAETRGGREVNLDRHHPESINPRTKIYQSSGPTTFFLASEVYPLRISFQSLAFLSSLDRQVIRRRFLSGDNEYQAPPNNFVWSCYSREREIQNVTAVLQCVVSEYEGFIRGCAFRLENSAYLNPAIAIVFQYVSSHDNPGRTEPTLHECHVRNLDGALPKITVLSASENPDCASAHPGSSVLVGNVRRVVETGISRIADFFFYGTPLLHLIYTFLAEDLNSKYNMNVIR